MIFIWEISVFDRIWGHQLPMQRAHHPHTSIHGKSVPHLGQLMPVFLCLDAVGRLAIAATVAGVDNFNKLHNKRKIMNTKA